MICFYHAHIRGEPCSLTENKIKSPDPHPLHKPKMYFNIYTEAMNKIGGLWSATYEVVVQWVNDNPLMKNFLLTLELLLYYNTCSLRTKQLYQMLLSTIKFLGQFSVPWKCLHSNNIYGGANTHRFTCILLLTKVNWTKKTLAHIDKYKLNISCHFLTIFNKVENCILLIDTIHFYLKQGFCAYNILKVIQWKGGW